MASVDLLLLVNSGAAAISGTVLVCMLQSKFRPSAKPFRYAVKALAGALIVVAASPWLGIPWSPLLDVIQNLSLAVVLVLMRQRQVGG